MEISLHNALSHTKSHDKSGDQKKSNKVKWNISNVHGSNDPATLFIDKIYPMVTETKKEAILFFSVCFARACQLECTESTIHLCGIY